MSETGRRASAGKDLLGIADLTPTEITLILDTAEAMKEIVGAADQEGAGAARARRSSTCSSSRRRARGRRSRSPRSASARTRSTSPSRTSSVVKGETLIDTALNLEAMYARHHRHAPRLVRARATCSRAPARPASSTPATACTSTRRRRCSTPSRSASARGASQGLKVAIIGDMLHSRVVRSNVLPADEDGRRGLGVRAADADAARASSSWACATTTDVDEAVARRRRGDDAAHPARAHAGRLLPVAARVLPACSA